MTTCTIVLDQFCFIDVRDTQYRIFTGDTRPPIFDNRIIIDNSPAGPLIDRGDVNYNYGAFGGNPEGERQWVGGDEYSSLDFDYTVVGYKDLDYNGNDVIKELGIGEDYSYRGNEVAALGGDGNDVIDVEDGSGESVDQQRPHIIAQEPR